MSVVAIHKLQYALCDPKGKPLCLHSDFDGALGAYAQSRRPPDIILDEWSRQRVFNALLRNKYSIRPCYAWVNVTDERITALPKERVNAHRSRK